MKALYNAMLLMRAQSDRKLAVKAQYGLVAENYGTLVLAMVKTLTQQIAHTGSTGVSCMYVCNKV